MSQWFVDYGNNDDHMFDSIRNESDFQEIVRNVEAKFQAENEKVGKWFKEHGIL